MADIIYLTTIVNLLPSAYQNSSKAIFYKGEKIVIEDRTSRLFFLVRIINHICGFREYTSESAKQVESLYAFRKIVQQSGNENLYIKFNQQMGDLLYAVIVAPKLNRFSTAVKNKVKQLVKEGGCLAGDFDRNKLLAATKSTAYEDLAQGLEQTLDEEESTPSSRPRSKSCFF